METPPETKPVHAMTDAERRELLRRRVATAAADGAMEIGGRAAGGRVVRGVAVSLAVAGVATAFVVAFYHFTASWRVAVVVVAAMLAYMAVVGRFVEGRADRIE